MVTKNPLRLIEMDAIPSDGSGASAPVVPIDDHDAITRRVPTLPADALELLPEPRQKHGPNWRAIIPAASVAVVVGAFVTAMLIGAKKPRDQQTPQQTQHTPQPTPQPSSQPPAPPVAHMAPTPLAPVKTAPSTIHVAIDAEPAEAELSLDGNVLATHRLRLEVPQDRGVHVVSASAPGYLPFNQPVSFGGDVLLTIRLHHSQAAPAHSTARSRASHSEAKHRIEAKPAPAPQPNPRLEPGMRLDGPSPRPGSMPIDEKNPYKP